MRHRGGGTSNNMLGTQTSPAGAGASKETSASSTSAAALSAEETVPLVYGGSAAAQSAMMPSTPPSAVGGNNGGGGGSSHPNTGNGSYSTTAGGSYISTSSVATSDNGQRDRGGGGQRSVHADDADRAAGAIEFAAMASAGGGGGNGKEFANAAAGAPPPPSSSAAQAQHHSNLSPTHQYYNHHQHMQMMHSHRSSMRMSVESAPSSVASSALSINTLSGKGGGDLEFFEDLVSEPVLVLGMDITHLSRNVQFLICASGVFFFSLLYGYLQELISVQLCNRHLGLFLAQVQFSGYTLLAYLLRSFVYEKEKKQNQRRYGGPDGGGAKKLQVPLMLYLGLSLLRAVDLGMTNLAMQYLNYPAKTLMKSSRVVFTMLFGVVIARKKYKPVDYMIVFAMVAGLAIFMHADANSSAVFHYMGVIMLTISLLCDGAISNMSESIMSQFGVGQDEFIFRMYSISLVAITAAACYKGDMAEGMVWLSQPGTYSELALPINERTWTVPGKVACLVLFSSMGFIGSSCAAAITKQFGALTMSITSTARKATTLFLSFFLFNNVCTVEHIAGIVVFISALTAKSLRRRKDKQHHRKKRHSGQHKKKHHHGQSSSGRRKHYQDGVEQDLPTMIGDTIELAPNSGDSTGRMLVRRSASREGSLSLEYAGGEQQQRRSSSGVGTSSPDGNADRSGFQRHQVHIV